MGNKTSDLEKGVQLFNAGCNCAQATLQGIAPDNMNSEQMQLICSAFGGGIARYGKTCGAVTGALMGVGLKYGYTLDTKDSEAAKCLNLSQLLVSKFEAEFGSSDCKALIGYDISDPEKKELAGKSGVFETRCPKFVAGAIKIVEELDL